MCSRASRQINAMKRVGRYMDSDGRLMMYKSFIRSNFSYCPVTWIFFGKKNSAKLEKLQERALRFVYDDYDTNYVDLLSKANLLSLSMFRLRFLAIEVYRCVTKINPKYMNDMFSRRELKYGLRDLEKLHQARYKTKKFGYRSFKYFGAKLWNALPIEIKRIDKLHIFKREL